MKGENILFKHREFLLAQSQLLHYDKVTKTTLVFSAPNFHNLYDFVYTAPKLCKKRRFQVDVQKVMANR